MKTLHISVADKIATYQKRDGAIVCGNNDYQIVFAFDDAWGNHAKKIARFIWNEQYYDVEFEGDTCPVPVIQNAPAVKVGVYAGDLQTTTVAYIECVKSILCEGNAPHPETGQHYTTEAKAAALRAKESEENAAQSAEAAEVARAEAEHLIDATNRIVQTTGESEDAVMSQKAVTDFVNNEVNQLSETIDRVTCKKYSSNLLDNSNVKVGYYAQDGQFYSGGSYGNYYYTDTLIPVKAGDVLEQQTTYHGVRYGQGAYGTGGKLFYIVNEYDENGNWLTGSLAQAHNYTAQNDGYIRVTMGKKVYDSYTDVAFVKNATSVLEYEEYSTKTLLRKNALLENIKDQSVSTETTFLRDSHAAKEGVLSTSVYFDGFTSVKIGYTKSDNTDTDFVHYFEVTPTKLISHINTNGEETTLEKEHGLTISNFVNISIHHTIDRKAKVKINSGSGSYEYTFFFVLTKRVYAYCTTEGTNVSNKTSFTIPTINKKSWFFGDSYFEFVETRWVYYLGDYRENALFNAHSGEKSVDAIADLRTALKFGVPQYLVWCLGMNDGSDTENDPSSAWKTTLDSVIALCKENEIELIMATIPTVPTVNNEKKNEFVRNSGYRYIDFAKAVGANSSGTWYSGLLSADNVHPSALGGQALCGRVLTDFPEITID